MKSVLDGVISTITYIRGHGKVIIIDHGEGFSTVYAQLDNIKINDDGLKHPIYKNKEKIFNTPAFNFDEVVTLPQNSTLLSSNSINRVMATNFKAGECEIWGIQYHPEITYKKMVSLIYFRKDRLLNNKAFKDEIDINEHVKIIENEDKITKKDARMKELENWLRYIDAH